MVNLKKQPEIQRQVKAKNKGVHRITVARQFRLHIFEQLLILTRQINHFHQIKTDLDSKLDKIT